MTDYEKGQLSLDRRRCLELTKDYEFGHLQLKRAGAKIYILEWPCPTGTLLCPDSLGFLAILMFFDTVSNTLQDDEAPCRAFLEEVLDENLQVKGYRLFFVRTNSKTNKEIFSIIKKRNAKQVKTQYAGLDGIPECYTIMTDAEFESNISQFHKKSVGHFCKQNTTILDFMSLAYVHENSELGFPRERFDEHTIFFPDAARVIEINTQGGLRPEVLKTKYKPYLQRWWMNPEALIIPSEYYDYYVKTVQSNGVLYWLAKQGHPCQRSGRVTLEGQTYDAISFVYRPFVYMVDITHPITKECGVLNDEAKEEDFTCPLDGLQIVRDIRENVPAHYKFVTTLGSGGEWRFDKVTYNYHNDADQIVEYRNRYVETEVLYMKHTAKVEYFCAKNLDIEDWLLASKLPISAKKNLLLKAAFSSNDSLFNAAILRRTGYKYFSMNYTREISPESQILAQLATSFADIETQRSVDRITFIHTVQRIYIFFRGGPKQRRPNLVIFLGGASGGGKSDLMKRLKNMFCDEKVEEISAFSAQALTAEGVYKDVLYKMDELIKKITDKEQDTHQHWKNMSTECFIKTKTLNFENGERKNIKTESKWYATWICGTNDVRLLNLQLENSALVRRTLWLRSFKKNDVDNVPENSIDDNLAVESTPTKTKERLKAAFFDYCKHSGEVIKLVCKLIKQGSMKMVNTEIFSALWARLRKKNAQPCLDPEIVRCCVICHCIGMAVNKVLYTKCTPQRRGFQKPVRWRSDRNKTEEEFWNNKLECLDAIERQLVVTEEQFVWVVSSMGQMVSNLDEPKMIESLWRYYVDQTIGREDKDRYKSDSMTIDYNYIKLRVNGKDFKTKCENLQSSIVNKALKLNYELDPLETSAQLQHWGSMQLARAKEYTVHSTNGPPGGGFDDFPRWNVERNGPKPRNYAGFVNGPATRDIKIAETGEVDGKSLYLYFSIHLFKNCRRNIKEPSFLDKLEEAMSYSGSEPRKFMCCFPWKAEGKTNPLQFYTFNREPKPNQTIKITKYKKAMRYDRSTLMQSKRARRDMAGRSMVIEEEQEIDTSLEVEMGRRGISIPEIPFKYEKYLKSYENIARRRVGLGFRNELKQTRDVETFEKLLREELDEEREEQLFDEYPNLLRNDDIDMDVARELFQAAIDEYSGKQPDSVDSESDGENETENAADYIPEVQFEIEAGASVIESDSAGEGASDSAGEGASDSGSDALPEQASDSEGSLQQNFQNMQCQSELPEGYQKQHVIEGESDLDSDDVADSDNCPSDAENKKSPFFMEVEEDNSIRD